MEQLGVEDEYAGLPIDKRYGMPVSSNGLAICLQWFDPHTGNFFNPYHYPDRLGNPSMTDAMRGKLTTARTEWTERTDFPTEEQTKAHDKQLRRRKTVGCDTPGIFGTKSRF